MPENDNATVSDVICEIAYGAPARSERELRPGCAEVRSELAKLRAVPGWTIVDNRRRQLVNVERAPFEHAAARAKRHVENDPEQAPER